jgi:hypothetical protein
MTNSRRRVLFDHWTTALRNSTLNCGRPDIEPDGALPVCMWRYDSVATLQSGARASCIIELTRASISCHVVADIHICIDQILACRSAQGCSLLRSSLFLSSYLQQSSHGCD